jgi:hypothetical protein
MPLDSGPTTSYQPIRHEFKIVSKAGDVALGQPPIYYGSFVNITPEQMSWVLNGTGGLSFSIPTIDDPNGPTEAQYSRQFEHEIQVWREGIVNPIFWGVPVNRSIGFQYITVDCKELNFYFARRFVAQNLWNGLPDDGSVPVLMEQQTIAMNLIEYAQNFADGDLGITIGSFSDSGVERAIDYPQDEHGRISDLVYKFSEFEDGFDFSIEIFADGRREWTPWYPRKGTTHTALRLEYGVGGNIVSFDAVEYKGDEMANEVIGTGNLGGPAKIEQTYRDQISVDATLLLQDVVSFQTVEEATDLLELAKAQVLARKDAPEIITLQCKEQYESADGNIVFNPIIGVLKVGDYVPVVLDHGEAQIHGLKRVYGLVYNFQSMLVSVITNR